MAIDPRISMAVQQASIAPAIDIFNRARQQQIANQRNAMFDPLRTAQMQQGLDLGQQQLQRQQSLMQDEESIRDMTSIANFFDINQQDFQVGNEQFLKQKILSSNLSPQNKQEAIQTLDSRGVDALSNQFGQVKNIVRGQQGQGLTAGQRERDALIRDLQSENPEVRQSAGVALGIVPRAGISAQERIAESPEVTAAVAESQAQIAGATQEATLGAKVKLEPELKRRVDVAKANVKQAADQAVKNKSNQSALNVYETGIENLRDALGDTSTGPLVGILPAWTANAQVAEGAISLMAPVLKQMFRGAGEGTFTDKDQELLLGMIPTRKDNPEAVQAKLSALDNLVRAKLTVEQPQQQQNTVGRFTIEVID